MASSTGQDIRQELLKWGILRLLGSATGGAANYITDSLRLISGAHPSTLYEDCWVRMTSGTSAGEVSKVDVLDQDLGRLYVTPSFGAAIATGETYEIIRAGIRPDDLDRARDEALTRYCSQWALQPLSELLNADWEDAIGTTWAVTSATQAIQTNIGFPVASVGRNANRVTNSGAGGYTQSTSLFTRPGQTFFFYVPVSARTGTAEVIVRDVTNSATVTTSGTATATGRGWTGIQLTGSVPAGCYEMAIRLSGVAATAVIDWGPVFFHWQGQRRIVLPDRLDSRDAVGRVYRLMSYALVGSGDDWGQEAQIEVPNVRRAMSNDNVFLQFSDESPMGDYPYSYQERIFYDTLSATYLTVAAREVGDAATTLCPLDYAAAGTVRVLAEWYLTEMPHESAFWQGLIDRSQYWLNVWERRHGPPIEPIATRDRSIYIPRIKV